MKLSLAEAEGKLDDLARRVESGDEIVLTRDGREIVKLVAIPHQLPVRERRRMALEKVLAAARSKGLPDEGPDAAHSQDFLYDEFGLPKGSSLIRPRSSLSQTTNDKLWPASLS